MRKLEECSFVASKLARNTQKKGKVLDDISFREEGSLTPYVDSECLREMMLELLVAEPPVVALVFILSLLGTFNILRWRNYDFVAY